ncbi:MAG: hypothetical protein ACOCVF_03280 [bacterium]
MTNYHNIFNILILRNFIKLITPNIFVNQLKNLEFQFATKPRFVITGTGRCGTGYISKLLTEYGINCGHEAIFSYNGVRNKFGYTGDASWLAAPYLQKYNGIVIHQVRHPLRVINSLLGIKFFDNSAKNPYSKFAKHYCKTTNDVLKDTMKFYILWNRMCEENAIFRYQVEKIDKSFPQIIQTIIPNHKYDSKKAYNVLQNTSKKINTRNKEKYKLKDLPDGNLKSELVRLAADYGYIL